MNPHALTDVFLIRSAARRARFRCTIPAREKIIVYALTKMVQRSNVFQCFAPPKLSGHPVKAHKPSPD